MEYDPVSGKLSTGGTLSSSPLVSLLGPGGVTRQVPQAQLSFFLESGYKLDTPEARHEIDLQAKYGEGLGAEVGAGLLGGARSLSFGVSDLLLQRTGLVGFEALRELKERNPNATLAGELGALAIPLGGELFGAGKVAAGLKGAGSGISGVAKLAGTIGEEAAKATGSKLLGSAAQASAEAFAYNVAKNLSESVLGDEKMTAQRLLAHSGQALAIGGGLGLGIPIAAKGVQLGAQKARQAIDALGTTLKERVLPAAGEAVAGAYSKAYGAVTGKGDEAANEVFAMLQGSFKPGAAAEREKFVRAISPDEFNQTHEVFTSQLSDAFDNVQAIMKRGRQQLRPGEMDNLLEGVEMRPALADFGQLINTVAATAKKMADEPLLYDQTYRREVERMVEALEQRVGSEAGGGKVGFESTKDLWNTVNKIKGSALNDIAYTTNLRTAGRAEVNAVMEMRQLYRSFKEHLENPALYGDAAARQASYNESISTLLGLIEKNKGSGAQGAFQRHFLGPDGFVDSAKTLKMLRKIGSSRDVESVAALEDFMAASRSFVDQAEKSSINAGLDGAVDRAGFESIVSKIADTQRKATEDLAAVSKIRSQDAFGMALLNFQKTVGDTLFRDGVFSATVKLAQKAASPFGVVKALSAAEGFALKTSGRISGAVGRMVDKMGSAGVVAGTAVRPYVEPASVKLLLGGLLGDDPKKATKDRNEAYQETLQRLSEAVADPATTGARLTEGVHAIAPHAPMLAQAVTETQMRAIQYLYEKAPKDDNAVSEGPFSQGYQPADWEIAAWERCAAAVQDPLSVLDELEHGTVTQEAVEALQAVYPALYEDVRVQLTKQITETKTNVPYFDRIQLSDLFGVDLDNSLDPAFVNAVQNGYVQAAAAQQSQRQSAYRPTSAAVKLGALEETPAQRIQRR